MDDWAAKIRGLEELGWSVSDLARAVEMSPGALSDIKHRRTKAPTGMSAVKLHHLHSTGAVPPQPQPADERAA